MRCFEGILFPSAGSTISAQYEYGPFGEVLRATGPMAIANPFRFSTKFQDDETGLLYYGYRYYDPSTGRWNSRDPIGESGGSHLYAFVSNSPIDGYDRLGLATAYTCDDCKGAMRDIKSKKYTDSVIKQLTGYLEAQSCAYDFACFEGEDCAKQKPPMVSSADAQISQRNYGPGKGTCTVRICASKIGDLNRSLRHELAHCVKMCGGELNDTCEKQLCHELYALAWDGRCDIHAGDPQKWDECFRNYAKKSTELTGLCKGKNMDAILTKNFVGNCRSGKSLKQSLR